MMDSSLPKHTVPPKTIVSKTNQGPQLWARSPIQTALIFLLCGIYVLFSTCLRADEIRTSACQQPQPAALPSNLSSFTDAPGFAEESAKRLAGAVMIPTMSFDDMGPVDEDERWNPFKDMHIYLKTTFPLTHSKLDLAIVGGYSLLFTWNGSSKNSKPLMLTGHIDVVPSLTSLDRWTYPPFSGTVDGEWIYGRGSGDCKNNVIGIMTAIEHLISSGWSPKRTIILAFGQDEEISGPRGATNIGIYLEKIYGKNGIEMIVDEGGMNIETSYGTEFALPGIAEKGYLNVEIEVDMVGGQSVFQLIFPKICIVLILADIIILWIVAQSALRFPHPTHPLAFCRRLCQQLSRVIFDITCRARLALTPHFRRDSAVFQPHVEHASPIWGYLTCVAEHGDTKLIPSWIKKGMKSKNPDMDEIARKFAEVSVGNRYLVQTSKAATIFNAGLKSNALAESARVLFNSRIDLFSSPSEVQKEYRKLIKPIAQKYSLLFEGATVSSPPYIGNITVDWTNPHEPSPISPFTIESSTAWLVFSRAVQASFGGDVITAPSAMTGNTGTYSSNSASSIQTKSR
ncbi:hypothetical protein CVT25_010514 [Psilocybe cyanescens]|uniref:Peptidase M20 dimerisation domain-containing protein n=1 Tax=Psilocybe cyanescens TaxID=93625 RepID=A0A409XPA3_PSICY|nr:hypothetical protein CVT25_010514 [Psilocybe cyanescens]